MAACSVKIVLIVAVVSLATADVLGHKLSSATRLSPVHPRVIGGAEIQNRCRQPYSSMVSLQFYANTGPFVFCSAVMISDTYLLTTGFCVAQIAILQSNKIEAVIGERDTEMVDSSEQRIDIQSYKAHPQYNSTSVDNNIAIIRLATPATLSSCVQPALKMETDNGACADMDESCVMAGWGPFIETLKPVGSRLPRQASVTLFGDLVTSLWSVAKQGREQPKGALYAESKNLNIKSCFFDWGGIVSCVRNGRYVLRGVIGEHNCNSETPIPMMVTDVTYFQSWIDRCTADWARCLAS